MIKDPAIWPDAWGNKKNNVYILSGDARMVDTVMVNGKITVEKGKLVSVNEKEKRKYANEIGRELLSRASSRIPGLKADLQ